MIIQDPKRVRSIVQLTLRWSYVGDVAGHHPPLQLSSPNKSARYNSDSVVGGRLGMSRVPIRTIPLAQVSLAEAGIND